MPTEEEKEIARKSFNAIFNALQLKVEELEEKLEALKSERNELKGVLEERGLLEEARRGLARLVREISQSNSEEKIKRRLQFLADVLERKDIILRYEHLRSLVL